MLQVVESPILLHVGVTKGWAQPLGPDLLHPPPTQYHSGKTGTGLGEAGGGGSGARLVLQTPGSSSAAGLGGLG